MFLPQLRLNRLCVESTFAGDYYVESDVIITRKSSGGSLHALQDLPETNIYYITCLR